MTSGIGALGEDAQAASVGWMFFHVEDMQAVGGGYTLHGGEREIGEVLVVDRVRLSSLDQIHQVGKLERGDPVGLQQDGKAGGKIIDVRNMGEDIVGGHEVGLPAFG